MKKFRTLIGVEACYRKSQNNSHFFLKSLNRFSFICNPKTRGEKKKQKGKNVGFGCGQIPKFGGEKKPLDGIFGLLNLNKKVQKGSGKGGEPYF